jgi:hypothetical protein
MDRPVDRLRRDLAFPHPRAGKDDGLRPPPLAVQPAQQRFDRSEPRRPRFQVAARDRGVERIVASDRVLGDPDRQPALVRVEHGRPDAPVEVDARDEERVGRGRREERLEPRGTERGEVSLRHDLFSGPGREDRRRLFAGGAADADPSAVRLPVRHPVVRVGIDRGSRVRDANPSGAGSFEEARRGADDLGGGGLETRGREVVVLEIDQKEERFHPGARRLSLSTAAAIRRPISSAPTSMHPSSAMSKVR